jgi:hypothetical protein
MGARDRELHEALTGAHRPAPPPMAQLVAVNRHVPVKHRKTMTELHLGRSGLERIDGQALLQYPSLERMWLNGNRIARVIGLEHSWRLKELYLQDNAITSILSPSCSLWHLRHLEKLDLSNNLLQGLTPTLDALKTKLSLTNLNLSGNPLCEEAFYRLSTLHQLRSVTLLDASSVTADERKRASDLFSPPKDKSPRGFGSRVQPYDPVSLVRGRPSAAEALLAAQVASNERRRVRAEAESKAAGIREAVRPSFDYAYTAGGATDATQASPPTSKEFDSVPAKHAGGRDPDPTHKRAPGLSSSRFEFVPRGRVPSLRVRAGALTLSSKALAAAAEAAGTQGGGSSPVYVTFNAWGALSQPLISRILNTSVYLRLPASRTPEMKPSLRTDEELISAAAGYERLTQLLATGPEELIAVTVTLCEAISGRPLASARVPVGEIVRDCGRDRAVHHARLELGACGVGGKGVGDLGGAGAGAMRLGVGGTGAAKPGERGQGTGGEGLGRLQSAGPGADRHGAGGQGSVAPDADVPFATLALIVMTDWGTSQLIRPTGCLPKPELPAAVAEARARAANVREMKDYVAMATWAGEQPPQPPLGSLPQGMPRLSGGTGVARVVRAV